MLHYKQFYKITNETEIHHNFQYKDGLNTLNEEFDEKNKKCGFNFTDKENIINFVWWGTNIREVFLPLEDKNFKYVQDGIKYRANMIIFGKKYDIFSPDVQINIFGKHPWEIIYNACKYGRLDYCIWWHANCPNIKDILYMNNPFNILSNFGEHNIFMHELISVTSANGHINILE